MPLRDYVARFATVFAYVGAIGGLLGCASSGPPAPELVAVDPFRVPDANLRQAVARLCLDSIASEIAIEDSEQRLSSFEELIVHRLESAGFQVVGSKETRKVREGIDDELGEAFDAHTGQAIAGSALAGTSRIRERLVDQLDCDAFVEVELAIVQAFWSDRVVLWDGREVWADGRDDLHQVGTVLRDLYIGGVRGWGAIPALSLHLAIRDREDRVIFWNAGGIQPIATLRSVPYQIRWDPLPDDQILIDPDSNQAAVDLAVGPLDAHSSSAVADCGAGGGGSGGGGASRSRQSTGVRAGCAHEKSRK